MIPVCVECVRTGWSKDYPDPMSHAMSPCSCWRGRRERFRLAVHRLIGWWF